MVWNKQLDQRHHVEQQRTEDGIDSKRDEVARHWYKEVENPVVIPFVSHYSTRMNVKEQVIQAIQRLPDDIDYRDITEEIALLAAVGEAEQDIAAGRVIDNEAMKARILGWTAG